MRVVFLRKDPILIGSGIRRIQDWAPSCSWCPIAGREIGLSCHGCHILVPNSAEQSDRMRSVGGTPLMGCEKQREGDIFIGVARAVCVQQAPDSIGRLAPYPADTTEFGIATVLL